jgi:glycosyltransferase involved in cell wall biosynthesis
LSKSRADPLVRGRPAGRPGLAVTTQVLYIAAHGGFSGQSVPLGGGAAVYDHLVEEWNRTRPFPLRLITPAVLGAAAPSGRDLVRFGERAYARFSRDFEQASTEDILRHDPAATVVLANDISEGPDFEKLSSRGYRVYTIYHVDVVSYVAAMYCQSWIRPETTVRWYPRVRALLPDMAQLVWAKQEASVRYSRGLIMPSEGMREVLLRCYPFCPPERMHVLPWGVLDIAQCGNAEPLRQEFGVPADARVLLTLSRISPEKGQDLLLQALLDWEQSNHAPQYPLWLFVCGDAAFMQGQRFLEKLKRLAARLRTTRVVFPGYVTGERKAAFFALADVFVFPSRYESYGLTLLEALAHGLPAVCLDHHGSRSVMREEFGAIVQLRDLRAALQKLLADDAGRKKMGEAAKKFAQGERFADRAAELARVLLAPDP